jgi:membrane protease subunit HflC
LPLIAIAALLILIFASVFTVNERERAILFRLGEIVRTDYEPGLHFKVPFITNVRKFDGRVLTLQIPRERFLTSEKKNVIVSAFVKWRIDDPAIYYTATGGDESRAGLRLSEIIKDGLRSEFGKRTIQEVVSGERAQIMDIMQAQANRQVEGLGINVVDVRVTRIDLPPEVSSSVFQRMRAERTRVAKEFRSQGEEEAIGIRAEANREAAVIVAEAQRDAQRIKGEGDARAAGIYANVYSRDPEFYSLHRRLAAYTNTFNTNEDMILLEPDSDFFRYFNNPNGGNGPVGRAVQSTGAMLQAMPAPQGATATPAAGTAAGAGPAAPGSGAIGSPMGGGTVPPPGGP